MNTALSEKGILRRSPFLKDDGFSYFCKYDELVGVVACPGIYLPPIDESCYVDITDEVAKMRDE